jgi:glycerol uptake facilitator-like aquaporin
MSLTEGGRGELEFDVEQGPGQSSTSAGPQRYPVPASKETSYPRPLKNLFKDENPWFSGAIFVTELLAVFTFVQIIQLARGFSFADPMLGALAIGGGFAGVYFMFGVICTPVHMNPIHSLLHAIFKNETWFNAILRIVAQLAAGFASTGFSRLTLDAAYVNTAIKLTAGVSEGEGLFVETLGGIFFAFAAIQLALYGEKGATIPITALLMGIATTAFQAFAFPLTGASFNVFRWLQVDSLGGDVALYFTEKWWIYLLEPVLTLIITGLMHLGFKWIVNNANDWADKHSTYKTV